MHVVTIIQARTGSTRMPGKVLLPLGKEPLLLHMINRVNAAPAAGTVIAATTTSAADDPIAGLCLNNNINLFRGSETDLLDRHYKAALLYQADAVVKIPSDCPLIDPEVIETVIRYYIKNHYRYDYVSNLHPASWPDGNDVEIFSMHALRAAWQNARRPLEREHTTPYIWENPHLFRTGNVYMPGGADYSMTHRWTIDYPDDYNFISAVFGRLYPHNPLFGCGDILELLEREPMLYRLNSHYAGVNWYRSHLDELKTISPLQTKILDTED